MSSSIESTQSTTIDLVRVSPQPISTAKSQTSKVLIVDDELMNRELMAFILKGEGYEILEAESGEDAIQILDQRSDIDLILLDISMPGMNGYGVLDWIKNHPDYCNAGVIMVTADEQTEQIVRAFKLGASDYITKPIDVDIAHIRIVNQLKLKQTQDALRETQERYHLAANGANDGLWDWNLHSDDLYVSARWRELFGSDASLINSMGDWHDRMHPADKLLFESELEQHLDGETKKFQVEHRIRHADGSFRWLLCRAKAVCNENGVATRVAGWVTDITEGKTVDELTGLCNRVSLTQRIERCIDQLKNDAEMGIAVLFLDLDNFKLINDGHGHDIGDEFLKIFANRLKNTLRNRGSMAARIGGDEFCVTVEDIPTSQPAAIVAQRILDITTEPIEIANQTFFPGVSVGIAYTRDPNCTAEDILRESDTAMYQAKCNGKNGYRLFDPEMQEGALKRLNLENELRSAVANDEFVVMYQPIMDIRNSRMIGFESLVRWNHPQRGIVSPFDFIGVAEKTGLIIPIGASVLRKTCHQLVEWKSQSAAFDEVTCNVNVSRMQLKPLDFPVKVRRILAESSLRPSDLQLEITESAMFDKRGNAQQVLTDFRVLGIKIALDDFGTGYSTLACLHNLPLDTLKIDRAFVCEMLRNKRSESIVRAILTLAEGLELKVCAEGIEKIEEQDFLLSLNCPIAQGYYYAKPMTGPELFQFAVEHNLVP